MLAECINDQATGGGSTWIKRFRFKKLKHLSSGMTRGAEHASGVFFVMLA
jgi:hypothetical protein